MVVSSRTSRSSSMVGEHAYLFQSSTSCEGPNANLRDGSESTSALSQPSFMVEGCEGPYIDFWSVPLALIKTQMQAPACKRKGPRGGVSEPFPVKLYEMLVGVAKEGQLEHVVAWQPHGRCFMIHHAQTFVDEIMPKYFKQSKLTSFQRQLNLYGFQRVSSGRDRGGYYHPLFLRGRADICKIMHRTRVKGGAVLELSASGLSCKAATLPTTFDALPPCGEACSDYDSIMHVSSDDESAAEVFETVKSFQSEIYNNTMSDYGGEDSNAISASALALFPSTIPIIRDSSSMEEGLQQYQQELHAATNETPAIISPELPHQDQHQLLPTLFRPELLTSSCFSALTDDVEDVASTDTVFPAPTLAKNSIQAPSQDLLECKQKLAPLCPPMSLQQESFYPRQQVTTTDDPLQTLVPNPLQAFSEVTTTAGGTEASSDSDMMGFFEGQTFRFMDEENLRVYESAVIGV